MTWQLLLMDANAIVCLLIMVRLMFFRKPRKDGDHILLTGKP